MSSNPRSSSTMTLELDSFSYRPGHTVSGTVVLNLSKDTCARCVKITWKGYQHSSGLRDAFGNEYKAAWKVLYGSSLPWVAENGNNTLPAGTHRYQFSFQLPHNIPSTFSMVNKKNFAYYYVKVQVHRPWYKGDYFKRTPFEVVKRSRRNGGAVGRTGGSGASSNSVEVGGPSGLPVYSDVSGLPSYQDLFSQ